MRAVASGDLAGRGGEVLSWRPRQGGIKPSRELAADLEVTEKPLKAGLA
jgi:hypothetical protein